MNQETSIAASIYHSFLRVTTLVIATVLVFESGMMGSVAKNIVDVSGQQLVGMVGMSASIAPNDLNVITAKLTEKEQQLALREAALTEREIAVSVGGGSTQEGKATFLLATVLFILLLLIILNYILDYLRSKERELAI